MLGTYRYGYYAIMALVAVEATIASLVGWNLRGLNPAEVFQVGNIRLGLAGWFLIPLLWLAAASVQLALRRIDRPTKAILRLIRWNRSWLIRGAILTAILIPLARAFGTLKTSIPLIVPFYADSYFITFDRMLLGDDAWRITHRFIGDVGTVVIDRIYILWFTCVVLLAGWFNFSRDPHFQLRGALSFNLCWFILGGIAAIGLSSVGPCFYERFFGNPHFVTLTDDLKRIHGERGLFAIGAMNFLLKNYGASRFGVGISAMPSLHVSIAFLAFLATLCLKRRLWIKLIAGCFAAIILIGSVHLGWHYAVDGIASIAGTWMIWFATGRFVDWVEKRGRPAPSTEMQVALQPLANRPPASDGFAQQCGTR